MRNLTKASRQASRNAQFESLLKYGYTQETYKGLEIFKNESELLLKVFEGTAANHSIFYKYRNIEQLEAKIQDVKSSFDRREIWKAEQKEKAKNNGSKITVATLKAFLKKNEDAIYVRVLSSFDGMQDMVDTVEDVFKLVKKSDNPKDYNLGFSGLYLVGHSRDSIRHYEDDIYTGFEVYNSCGLCLVATPKKVEQPKTENKSNPNKTTASGKIQIVDYSEKAIAVTGDFSEHYDNLINLGGKYNSRLSCGRGIIFSKKRLDAVKDYFLAQKQDDDTNVQDEQETTEIEQITPRFEELDPLHPLNICDPESGQYKEALKEYQESQETPAPEMLQIPQGVNLELEAFTIIWHEGYQVPSYEGKTFTDWDTLQRVFYNLWDVNEKGQDGGYTKVKCKMKLKDTPEEIFRIDITDKAFNGDFNPSLQHIIEYIAQNMDEPTEPNKTPETSTISNLFEVNNN